MPFVAHGLVRKRVVGVFVLFTMLIVLLGGRLFYLQFYQNSRLSGLAEEQRIREIPVEAKRGVIYDRNGKVLGISSGVDSVYAIPAEIYDIPDTAAKLAAILVSDPVAVTQKLSRRQAFTWLARKVSPETAASIRALQLPGIGLTEENSRLYPYDQLAAHVLGFTGIDSQGLDGIEAALDEELKGVAGKIVVEYDGRGHEIPQAAHKYIAPVGGHDIYLTIDAVIQQIVERELDAAMQETQAQKASVIAMNPQTGEILALANRPAYNPNRFGEYAPEVWRNIAISNAYEPGSTFKILTTAAALDAQVVSLRDEFFDPGGVEVQGRTIHCWKAGGHGQQSFAEVVQNSCNTGFVNVGLRLGRDTFYQYIERFGLGKTTGIDLPGEAKGIVIAKDNVKPINLAVMAIGQSIAVTPLQLLTAISAAVGGGNLLKPQLVKEIRGHEDQVIQSFTPVVKGAAISASTVNTVRQVLTEVVNQGTGRSAAVEGYLIGGKTGTAQKAGAGGYLPDAYLASFAGFAPSEQPQIALLVVIDEPVGLYYGGQVAAPIFARIMNDVLPYLAIPTQVTAAPGDTRKP